MSMPRTARWGRAVARRCTSSSGSSVRTRSCGMHLKLLMMPALVTACCSSSASACKRSPERQRLFAGNDPSERWFDLRHAHARVHQAGQVRADRDVERAARRTARSSSARSIDRLADHPGRALAGKLEQAPDFELGLYPSSNIVCYRHRPEGVEPRARTRRSTALGLPRRRWPSRTAVLHRRHAARRWVLHALGDHESADRPSDFDELIEHLRTLCPR